MTNKVKPFYIRITDDMTPQMVQDAFDKCVDAGANAFDGILGCDMKHSYDEVYEFYFVYFGVDFERDTYLTDDQRNYGTEAQEITLDQLDEWLGLEVEQEWKNGDECVKNGEKYIYIAKHPTKDGRSICVHAGNGLTYTLITGKLSKPETPEQKAEREKREEAKEMIQCLLDNYTKCEESAIEYVIDYLKECESLGR